MILARALAGFHSQEALMVLNPPMISDVQLESVKRLVNAQFQVFLSSRITHRPGAKTR